MGCHPSKSKTEELVNELNHLRKQKDDYREQIKKLRRENNDLRGQINPGANFEDEEDDDEEDDAVIVHDNDDVIKKLEEENANLRKENEQLKIATNRPNLMANIESQQANSAQMANLPKVGDKVLAMWSVSMWQYFTATIIRFDPQELKFEIEWDDQDPSGRIIDYYNLALDRVPDDDEIAVGSIVLFPQGNYCGQEGVRLGGQRWHQGKITEVSKTPEGQKLYGGVHTKGGEDDKWITYKGYSPEFSGLKIYELRIAPNVLDLLSADMAASRPDLGGPISTCDVFLSYSKLNSFNAIQNNEISQPPSYEEAVAAESFYDPRSIREHLSSTGLSVGEYSGDLVKTIDMIQNAKVIVAFLSDQYVQDEMCRQEFQYAKKTARKPIIPVVVGNSFDWMMSVVGLLIAGELYIHFKDQTVKDMKMNALLEAVKRNVPSNEDGTLSTSQNASLPPPKVADVFISYCWRNSNLALETNQIQELVGNVFADPRRIKNDLSQDLSIWLDIERLQTTNQSEESMSMFQQIALGISKAKVVLVFISAEYAKSDNCRAEFQFALTSLKKPIVPVIVGKGDAWRQTVIGLLASAENTEPVDMQNVYDDGQYKNCLKKIQENILEHIFGTRAKEAHTFAAPKIGDHVVCLHQRWAYFYATIGSFNGETLEYTVNWDDKDPSGRTQSYKDVAIDAVPSKDQVGVESIVLFPQGSYGATEGNNTGGERFHQGIVTRVYKDEGGTTRYDGHHTKGGEDGKWVTYKGYQYEFAGLQLEQLRVSPNAMDALVACKKEFLVDED